MSKSESLLKLIYEVLPSGASGIASLGTPPTNVFGIVRSPNISCPGCGIEVIEENTYYDEFGNKYCRSCHTIICD